MAVTDWCVQAVVTRYLGPTNYRGARIKATASAGTVTIPYPYELDERQAHWAAASKLIDHYEWPQENWACGGMPDKSRDSYVFVRNGGS